jgi:hypothetical protein
MVVVISGAAIPPQLQYLVEHKSEPPSATRTCAHPGIPQCPGTWIALFEQSGNETEAEDLAAMLLLAAVTVCIVLKGATELEIELLAAGDEELLLDELKLLIALEAMVGVAD